MYSQRSQGGLLRRYVGATKGFCGGTSWGKRRYNSRGAPGGLFVGGRDGQRLLLERGISGGQGNNSSGWDRNAKNRSGTLEQDQSRGGRCWCAL